MMALNFLGEAEFTFLQRVTGTTQGNLSVHLSTLEKKGYVASEKLFANKRPYTLVCLTEKGKEAYKAYREMLESVLQVFPT